MAALTSSVDSKSKEFKANAAAMAALVEELRRRREEAALGGTEKARERHAQARQAPAARARDAAAWTPARRFSSFRRSRPTASMTTPSTAPG